MSTEPHPQPTGDQDVEIARYRALSGSAVLAFIWGLLSPLAMVDPTLWIVPLLGILFGLRALWCITRNIPELGGRKIAVLGLLLSVLFGAAGITDRYAHRWLIRHEARKFAEAWFQFLVDKDEQRAYQLTIHPRYRQKLDVPIGSFYSEGPKWQRKLEDYVEEPLVHTLLALGPKTKVRYYETEVQGRENKKLKVFQKYAVTFDDENGRRKSFFVGVVVERIEQDDGTANWQIVNTNQVPQFTD